MLVRQCAGGVVFLGDKVFLLKNDKGEWVLPKGVIRNGKTASEVALSRVRYEGGVSVEAPVTSPEAWRGMAETNLRLLRRAFGDLVTEGAEEKE